MVLLAFVQAVASKLCLHTGEWYRNEKNNTWTNYSLCYDENNLALDPSVNDSSPIIPVSTGN